MNDQTDSTEESIDWVNRLAKWRMVFAGWQLGTRAKGDAEGDAVRDHREVTLLMRAELNALTAVLIAKKVFTAEEFSAQLDLEAKYLCEHLAKRFPGFRAQDDGIAMSPTIAADTTAGWRP
jgi:hypothetical protein